jgi:hypothetical protein
MQFKVFVEVYFRDLEKTINEWLSSGQPKTIKNITQSQADNNYINLTILYE